jgi:hypothetical protein
MITGDAKGCVIGQVTGQNAVQIKDGERTMIKDCTFINDKFDGLYRPDPYHNLPKDTIE